MVQNLHYLNIRTWNEEESDQSAEKVGISKKEIEKQSTKKEIIKSSVFPIDSNEHQFQKTEAKALSIERSKTSNMYHSMIPSTKKETIKKTPINNIQNKKDTPKKKPNPKNNVKATLKNNTKKTSIISQGTKITSSTPDPSLTMIPKSTPKIINEAQQSRKRLPKKRATREYLYETNASKKYTPKRYKNRHRNDRYENHYPNYRIKYFAENGKRKEGESSDSEQEAYVRKYVPLSNANVKGRGHEVKGQVEGMERSFSSDDDSSDRVEAELVEKKRKFEGKKKKKENKKKGKSEVDASKVKHTKISLVKMKSEKSVTLENKLMKEQSKRASEQMVQIPDKKKLLSTPTSEKNIQTKPKQINKSKLNPQSDIKANQTVEKSLLQDTSKTYLSPQKVSAFPPKPQPPLMQETPFSKLGTGNPHVYTKNIIYPPKLNNLDLNHDQHFQNIAYEDIISFPRSPDEPLGNNTSQQTKTPHYDSLQSPEHILGVSTEQASESVSISSHSKPYDHNAYVQHRFSSQHGVKHANLQSPQVHSNLSYNGFYISNPKHHSPRNTRINRESRTVEHLIRRNSDQILPEQNLNNIRSHFFNSGKLGSGNNEGVFADRMGFEMPPYVLDQRLEMMQATREIHHKYSIGANGAMYNKEHIQVRYAKSNDKKEGVMMQTPQQNPNPEEETMAEKMERKIKYQSMYSSQNPDFAQQTPMQDAHNMNQFTRTNTLPNPRQSDTNTAQQSPSNRFNIMNITSQKQNSTLLNIHNDQFPKLNKYAHESILSQSQFSPPTRTPEPRRSKFSQHYNPMSEAKASKKGNISLDTKVKNRFKKNMLKSRIEKKKKLLQKEDNGHCLLHKDIKIEKQILDLENQLKNMKSVKRRKRHKKSQKGLTPFDERLLSTLVKSYKRERLFANSRSRYDFAQKEMIIQKFEPGFEKEESKHQDNHPVLTVVNLINQFAGQFLGGG